MTLFAKLLVLSVMHLSQVIPVEIDRIHPLLEEENFQVAEASESDAREIYEVVNEAYKRDFFRYPERARTSYEKVLNYFLDGQHTWYVIQSSRNRTKEIACAVLYSTDNAFETPMEGNIHMLSARKAYWGKKLSIPLLKSIEERAIQNKKSTIRLIVANTNQGLIPK